MLLQLVQGHVFSILWHNIVGPIPPSLIQYIIRVRHAGVLVRALHVAGVRATNGEAAITRQEPGSAHSHRHCYAFHLYINYHFMSEDSTDLKEQPQPVNMCKQARLGCISEWITPLSLCPRSKGKYYSSSVLSPFHFCSGKTSKTEHKQCQQNGGPPPLPDFAQRNFGELLFLKCPLILLEQIRSDLLGCSAVVTGSRRSLLGRCPPVSMRVLSIHSLGSWGQCQFQLSDSPADCGWRKVDQELQTRPKSTEMSEEWAIQAVLH